MTGNVITRYAVGSGREGHDGNMGVMLLECSQLGVLGAEIVSSLRDAMGFIDGKQTDSVRYGTRPTINLTEKFFG